LSCGTLAKLVHTIGQARNAALAGVPIAGGQVVQHELQAVVVKALLDVGGGKRVGKQKLDGGEARLGRALEAVEERMLGEHHRQIGGELGHWKLRSS
jgi:hypothetical protein